MKHWKYFGYKPMLKRVKFYNTVKKYFKIGNQHNIYFKKNLNMNFKKTLKLVINVLD